MPEPTASDATTTRDFLVPDLGEGLEDATLVEWRVEVGEDVALNQTLCVLETAKAEVEIPSPFAGRIVDRSGDPGDTLDVGTVLARIAVSGTPVSSTAPPAGDGQDGSDESGSVLVGYGTSTGTSRRRRGRRAEPAGIEVADAAPASAPEAGTAERSEPDAAPAAAAIDQSHVRAKPKARKLARELGVDLETLAPGSGPDGIVTKDDVLAAAEASTPLKEDRPPVRSTATSDRTVPVLGVRARIADHLTESHRSIPAASASVDIDCTRLLQVRAALNDDVVRAGREPVVTPFSLLAHLLVTAVRRNPTLNASFDPDGRVITLHGDVHLGVGAATDRGLVVPVVRSAEDLSVLELSSELRRLAVAARDGSLAPTDMIGSTITVSNFGALGLDSGTPIINAPEAAIVGVGAIRERAVVVDGEIVARPTTTITCSFDHRISDGSEIGSFLSDLRSLIEEPARAL